MRVGAEGLAQDRSRLPVSARLRRTSRLKCVAVVAFGAAAWPCPAPAQPKVSGGTGTKLMIEACNGQRNQLWSRNSSGEYVLAFQGLCLTDPSGSTTNGTQVKVQTCSNASDQHWSIP